MQKDIRTRKITCKEPINYKVFKKLVRRKIHKETGAEVLICDLRTHTEQTSQIGVTRCKLPNCSEWALNDTRG